jgi:hypothetical protein
MTMRIVIRNTTIITAFLAAMPGCEVGEVNVTTTTDREDTAEPETGESSGPGPGATSTTGATETTAATSSESETAATADSTTAEPLPSCELEPTTDAEVCTCQDALPGSHDWWFSGCCVERFGTCSAWCADHGFGECLMVAITYDAPVCDLDAPELYLEHCEEDPWDLFQEEALAVRCICDAA